MRKRLALLLLLPWLLAFEWPGRLARLQEDAAHADVAKRRDAVRALARYPEADTQEGVLRALEDNDESVRLEAARTAGLTRMSAARPILLDWLHDKEPNVRAAAMLALSRFITADDLPALTKLLQDPAVIVRLANTEALRALGANTEATTALLAAAQDAEADVRRAAIDALAQATDARAYDVVSARTADGAVFVREAAVRALGKLHDKRAITVLLRLKNDAARAVRVAALLALGELGDPTTKDALREVLQREPALASYALSALSRFDDPGALDALLNALAVPEQARVAQAALVAYATRAGAETLVQALTARIHDATSPQALNAAVDTLAELAALAPIDNAAPVLQEALKSQRGAAPSLWHALSLTRAPTALALLVDELRTEKVQDLQGLLAAITRLLQSGQTDERLVEALTAHLPKAPAATQILLVTALGMSGDAKAGPTLLPLLSSDSPALRAAAIEALGNVEAIPAKAALLGWLRSDDPDMRMQAARALRKLLSEDDVVALLEALAHDAAIDRSAVISALTFSLGRLEAAHALKSDTRKRALEMLHKLAQGDDETLSDRALGALRSLHASESSSAVAKLLRSALSRRRSGAAATLAAFDGEETRHFLRYLLLQPSVPLAVAVAGALAEVGDERDAAALMRLTTRKYWPVPAAASYALARLAQRGVIKKHAMVRTLCELGRSPEPYVRANVAAALGALGAPACSAEVDPLVWLTREQAPALRVAAAHWARATLDNPELVDAATKPALRACAIERDAALGLACNLNSPRAANSARETVELRAHAADGSALRDRLVAVRLPDGAVFVGYTDTNAQLMLQSVPKGELILEDPTMWGSEN